MRIPNKINLPYKDGRIVGLIKDDGVPFKNVDGNIEYIRKDALLEYLTQELTEQEKAAEKYGDPINYAIASKLGEVIDKINRP